MTNPSSSSSEDSDDESEYSDEDDDGEDEDPYYIPKIPFDMETKTGKHKKSSKRKSKEKLRYPHPYMFLPRHVLLKVQDRDSYDDLSFEEYVWGMCGIISMVHKRDDAAKLLVDHLLSTAEDASQYDWEAVRNFTNVCFDKVERGDMSWQSREEIREQRIKFSWITGARNMDEPQPCHAFNTSVCDKEDRHIENKTLKRHRCAVCWYGLDLRECTHAAKNCGKRHNLSYKATSNHAAGPHTSYRHKEYQKPKHENANHQGNENKKSKN